MAGEKGNLQDAEFKYMGHYGKQARYAIYHLRMQQTSQGMVVRGTSGWYNGLRCVNLHVTHQVLVEDNVCFSSSSTSYFVELDSVVTGGIGDNADNVFVHNIAIGIMPKHFDDRLDDSVFGERDRSAVDFWPSTTNHEAYLGNVSVGDGALGDECQGFHFQQIGGTELGRTGVIPWTMVHNEAHSKTGFGIHTWQNPVPGREIVDFLFWRNGHANKYCNAQLLENGKIGVFPTSVDLFLQDSIVTGSTVDNSSEDSGFLSAPTPPPNTPLIQYGWSGTLLKT
jgi:hypothetical protein